MLASCVGRLASGATDCYLRIVLKRAFSDAKPRYTTHDIKQQQQQQHPEIIKKPSDSYRTNAPTLFVCVLWCWGLFFTKCASNWILHLTRSGKHSTYNYKIKKGYTQQTVRMLIKEMLACVFALSQAHQMCRLVCDALKWWCITVNATWQLKDNCHGA